MKNISFYCIFLSAAFISGCQKEPVARVTQPGEPAPAILMSGQLPHFDETNSTLTTWDQLPQKMRSAEKMNPAAKPDEGTSRSYSYYKYYIGPWGGGGGNAYSIYPYGSGDRIYAIAFKTGNTVDAVSFWYARPDGSLYLEQAGGTGGSYYIQYLAADEYITAIHGRSGIYLDHLGFITNRKVFDYGGTGGTFFLAGCASSDQILGIFGGAGIYLDRAGAYAYSR